MSQNDEANAQEPKTFQDIVRSPELFKAWGTFSEPQDTQIEEAKKWSPENTKDVVYEYAFGDEPDAVKKSQKRILEKLGSNATDAVIVLLKEHADDARLMKADNVESFQLDNSPFLRLLAIVENPIPAQLAAILRTHLKSAPEQSQVACLKALLKSNQMEVVQDLKWVFSQSNRHLIFSGLVDLRFEYIPEKQNIVEQLTPDLEKLLNQHINTDLVADLLLERDVEHAIRLMINPTILNIDNPGIDRLLDSLNSNLIILHRQDVLSMIEQIETRNNLKSD